MRGSIVTSTGSLEPSGRSTRAVGFSAVFFALAHMQSAYFLPLTVIGAALALAYERTGRLTTSIFLHGAINLWTVLMIGLA